MFIKNVPDNVQETLSLEAVVDVGQHKLNEVQLLHFLDTAAKTNESFLTKNINKITEIKQKETILYLPNESVIYTKLSSSFEYLSRGIYLASETLMHISFLRSSDDMIIEDAYVIYYNLSLTIIS